MRGILQRGNLFRFFRQTAGTASVASLLPFAVCLFLGKFPPNPFSFFITATILRTPVGRFRRESKTAFLPHHLGKLAIIIILVIAVIAIVLAYFTGFASTRTATRIGYSGNEGWRSWSGSYALLDGAMKKHCIQKATFCTLPLKPNPA